MKIKSTKTSDFITDVPDKEVKPLFAELKRLYRGVWEDVQLCDGITLSIKLVASEGDRRASIDDARIKCDNKQINRLVNYLFKGALIFHTVDDVFPPDPNIKTSKDKYSKRYAAVRKKITAIAKKYKIHTKDLLDAAWDNE